MKPALKTAKSISQSKSKKKQHAGSYNLIKGTKIQLSPFCDLYQACNRETKQVWHAKIINNQMLHRYDLEQCLQFNIQILQNCQKLQYVIFVQQIFEKGKNTFIIQQKYQKTLVDHINQFYPLPSHQIQDILSQVISGLLQIYKQQYATRSLRPEHIVCVDDVWKIQSFVCNSEFYGIESQYCWSYRFASPQDKKKQQQLSDRQIDQQIVWNVGILGLYMILGAQYDYEKITKDSDIPWAKVKQNTSESLFRFLVKALKTDFKDRMRLRQLLENQMFAHLNQSTSTPFLSYSKFFGEQSDRQKKQQSATFYNLSQQNQKKMKILQNDIQRFMYFGEVQKYIQQLPFKNNFDSSLIRYLCFKISFENLSKIKTQIVNWKRANPSLNNSLALKQIQQDLNIFIKNVKQSKISYSKILRGIQSSKSEVSTIRSSLPTQIIDDKIPYSEVINLYNILAGSIYTLIARQCLSKPNESKQRTLCFYTFGAYLLHFYDSDKFKGQKTFFKNNILSLIKLINQAPTKNLISLSQSLVKQYFAVTSQI